MCIDFKRTLIIFFALLLLAGCATTSPTSQNQGWSAERYYNEARQAQLEGDYETAHKYFSELEIRYPFSNYAQLAPLEIAFALYKSGKYEQSSMEADRFISYQPDHQDLDYAYYLKGLASAKQGIQENQTNVTEAQVQHSREAFQHFSELSKRFPESKYRENALQRMTFLREALADHELTLAKQQIDAGQHAAARERTQYITENYPNTKAAAEVKALAFFQPTTLPPSDLEIMPNKQLAQIHHEPAKRTIEEKGPFREAWLLQQDPELFTVQIAGTSREPWLEAFIDKFKLHDKVAYYQKERGGKSWYTAVYGKYNSLSEASEAAKSLKSRLHTNDAWVRKFKDIQTALQGTVIVNPLP